MSQGAQQGSHAIRPRVHTSGRAVSALGPLQAAATLQVGQPYAAQVVAVRPSSASRETLPSAPPRPSRCGRGWSHALRWARGARSATLPQRLTRGGTRALPTQRALLPTACRSPPSARWSPSSQELRLQSSESLPGADLPHETFVSWLTHELLSLLVVAALRSTTSNSPAMPSATTILSPPPQS